MKTLHASKSDLLTQIRQLEDLQNLQKDKKDSDEFKDLLTAFKATNYTKIDPSQIDDVITKLKIIRDNTGIGTVVNTVLNASSSIAQGASNLAQAIIGSGDKTVQSASGKTPDVSFSNVLLQVKPRATQSERALYRIVENILLVYGFLATVGGSIAAVSYVCKEDIIKIVRKASFMILETQNNNTLTGDEKKKINNKIMKGLITDIGTVIIADKTGADVGVIAATGIAQGDRNSLSSDAQSLIMSAAINNAITSLSPDDNTSYVYDKKAVSSGNYTSNLDKIQQQYNLKSQPSSSLSLSESEPFYDFNLDDSSPFYDYSSIYPSYQELLDMEREHNASLAS